MKTKLTFITLVFLSIGFSFAQDQECMTKLSIFHEDVKAGNFDKAYQPWMDVRTKCPKFNNAIHVDGDKILEHKIENSTGTEKIAFIKDQMKLWDEKIENFPSKAKVGDILSDKAQLMYDYKTELGLSTEELYNAFDKAYTTDLENFKNPKALYTYFSLMVDLYDNGKKTAQQLFDKYDDVVDKMEAEEAKYSQGLNELLTKENAGNALSTKEQKYKKYYEGSLRVLEQVAPSVDGLLGERANCQNLVPLYQKDYEANKNNAQWLQRAMNKLYTKGCKSDPMFVKIVKQKNTVQPNAKTAYYLYIITGEQKYFDQTLQLENDPVKKARLYNTIAGDYKKSGRYSDARNYYEKAMQINPSDKKPYEMIARMYAASANNCGDSNFNKRAVFWLAANLADKAGNSALANSYRAKAPSKSEIFSAGKAGQSIRIGCWIGRSVTVPNV